MIKKIVQRISNISSSNFETDLGASEYLCKILNGNNPVMIGRFGSTEIKAVLYPNIVFLLRPIFHRLMGYNNKTGEFRNMYIYSGFFPSNKEMVKRFSALMYHDLKELDVLGSWRLEERFLAKEMSRVKRVRLDLLEPYFQKNPWSQALANKRVLVIHPFSETIEKQYYNKRKLLFKDSRVLPEFQTLQTIKAVQTIAGNRSPFKDWFEALAYMKNEIDKRDFDIAIIGCGAYGFPLAAHVKRMGKKAVHLGGATQILFGIKGRRWLNNNKFDDIINEHFVFPDDADKVKNANKVEDGCYW